MDIDKSRKNAGRQMTDRRCFICDGFVPPFSITPLLKDEDGNLNECCESCADEQFPGWREDEDDE